MSNFRRLDIPEGDKVRTQTFTLTSATEGTLLTVASGGGVIWEVVFNPTGWVDNVSSFVGSPSTEKVKTTQYVGRTLTNYKLTVDGAAERTYTLNQSLEAYNLFLFTPISSSTVYGGAAIQATPKITIMEAFNNSATLKMTVSHATGGSYSSGPITGYVLYSVR
jgi:hypothetical protein